MKPLFFTILLGFGLMAGLKMTRAQTEELPSPQPPYIQPVPDYGHWKVTFKYKEAAPSPAASAPTPVPAPAPASGPAPVPTPAPTPPSNDTPSAIETIKTGDLRGVTLTFTDGSSKEYTCQGDWVLNSIYPGLLASYMRERVKSTVRNQWSHGAAGSGH